MSKTIDQRVVEMKFDNKQFEKNVQTSMSTLDKLKQKLNLDGAAKGLENVENASKNVRFSSLSSAVENVGYKFSAMQVMGVTALANITNSAVNAGKRIASALTIDPIKTGLSEYETQINAVQTILANTESKGTTLQQVNAALDELNTYADKTIYNFTEMTRNIGTFTAAGVDLKTSVSSIKGIANLAAVSGSSSQQASTAMYQLSQALAAGKVSLMDWNSVVNAGMGGQVFQDALKRTAKTMGKDVDGMIKKYGSFRESLTQGEWLTTDVLTKTLEQFTMAAEEGTEEWENYKKSLKDQGYTEQQAIEILKMANTATDAATKVKTFTQLWDTLKESAQSGWTQTWEIIIGDFGEAKEFLTNISDTIGGMIGAANDARNQLLSSGLSSGWKQLLGAGIADEAGFQETIQTVAKESGFEFDKLIKETELKGGTYNDALKQALTDGGITSDTLSESVSRLSKKMQDMTAKEREAAGYTVEHVQQIKKLDEELKNGTISMDEFVKKMLRPSGRENLIESLSNTFTGLMNIIKPVKEAFSEIFPAMTGEQLYNITKNLRDLTARFAEITETYGPDIKSTFKGVFAVLDIGVSFVKELVSGFFKVTGSLLGFTGGILSGTASLGEWLSSMRDSIKESGVFAKVIGGVVRFLQNGIEKLQEFTSYVGSKISMPGFDGFLGVLMRIWDIVSKLGSQIGEAFTNALRSGDINAALEVFNTGIIGTILLSVSKFMKNLTGIFDESKGILGNLKDILGGVKGVLESYQQDLKANILLKIAKAVGILAASIVVLAMIKPEKLDIAIGAITALFAELLTSFAVFNSLATKTKGALKASIAITSLASAMLILSAAMKIMSTLSWDELKVGLAGVAGGLTALVVAVNFLPENKVMGGARAIKKLSTSLVIFAVAMKILGSMNWDELKRGLAGMAGGLTALVVAVNLLPKSAGLKTMGMIGVATSLVILGGALKVMSSMSWDEIKRGLSVMSGALVALVLAINLLPKTAAIKTAGMIGVATSLVILGGALKLMATMNADEIKRSLTTMGIALVELVAALNLMRGTLGSAAALLIVSGALAILAPVIMLLSQLSWDKIKMGLLALGGALAVIGVAGLLLKPLIPALLGLAGAFALVGVGTVAIGVGLGLVATGITALSIALASGATAIVAGLSAIIIGILGIIPDMVKVVGELIKVLCKVLIECAPLIAETIGVVLVKVLSSLVKYTPQIVSSIFELLIGVLKSIRDQLPALIVVAVEVIGAFFQGIVDAIGGIDTTNLIKGIAGVGLLSALMLALSAVAGLVPGAMVGVLGMGVLIAELALVLAAIGGLAQIPGLSWLIEEGGDFLQTIGIALGKFVGGIVSGIAAGATSLLPQVGSNLSDFMSNLQPFINGAKNIDSSVLDGVKNIAEALVIITGAQLLEGITSWLTGGSSLSDFGSEIALLGTSLNQFVTNLGSFDAAKIATVSCACGAIKMLADAASKIPNEGGLWAKLAGENSLVTFGSYLPGLAKDLNQFISNLGTFDESKLTTVDCAGRAVSVLAKAAQEIPNEGGLWAKLVGENSLATFGSYLPGLGTNLNQFISNLGSFDESKLTAIDCAGQAIVSLAKAAEEIPNEGGLWASIVGDNSLSTFADKLPGLGTNLNKFITNIGTFDESSIATVKCVGNTIKTLADAANKIPNEGGLWAKLAGDNSLSTFADKLPGLGTHIKDFISNLGTFDESKLATVKSAANALEVIAGLGKLDLKSFGKNVENFGGKLSNFATKLNSFYSEMNKTGATTVDSAISQIKDLLALTQSVADANVKSFATFGESLEQFAVDGVNGFVEAFTSETPKLRVTNGATELSKAVTSALSSKTFKSDITEAGKAVSTGFANGIINNKSVVTSAGTEIGKAALKAAKKAIDSNSPSKEAQYIGEDFDLGFVNGIKNYASRVYDASYGVGDSARNGLSKAISTVSNIINSDIDTQPTIRPVLDLSDIKNGARGLNNMFNNGPSIGVISNLQAISSGVNARLQNGPNEDVVSAIDKLRKGISNVGGDTYNINGVAYADTDKDISDAVKTIVRAAVVERRV